MTDEPQDASPSAPTRKKWYEIFSLKEITATGIALSILFLNVFVVYYIFKLEADGAPPDLAKLSAMESENAEKLIRLWNDLAEKRFSRAKDILLVATGFLGIVLGYYFGRLPAEKALEVVGGQVETAQTNAEAAQQNAADANAAKEQQASAHDTELNEIAGIASELSQPPSARAGGKQESFTAQSAKKTRETMQRLHSAIAAAKARR